MKTVAALLLVVVVIHYSSAEDDPKAFFKEIEKACIEQNDKLTKEDIEGIETYKPTDSRPTKCFQACLLEKLELMKDGTLNKEGMNKIMEKILAGKDDELKKAKEAMEKCAAEVEKKDTEDKCERAHVVSKCVMNYTSIMKE